MNMAVQCSTFQFDDEALSDSFEIFESDPGQGI